MWNREIVLLGDRTVLVECGPMRMFIDACKDGVRNPVVCREAAERAIGFLEDVASSKEKLKTPAVILRGAGPGKPCSHNVDGRQTDRRW